MSRWQNHIQHRGPRLVISPRTVRLIMLTTAGGAVFPPISGFGAFETLDGRYDVPYKWPYKSSIRHELLRRSFHAFLAIK